jgi:hypothetical protein
MQAARWAEHRATNGRGIERIRKARTIHGGRSAELLELRREIAEWKRLARAAIRAVE